LKAVNSLHSDGSDYVDSYLFLVKGEVSDIIEFVALANGEGTMEWGRGNVGMKKSLKSKHKAALDLICQA